MSYSHAFICLSHLFSQSGFEERDQNETYTYFTKNEIHPIQINRLKISYSDLELSSYALRIGQNTTEFISRFNIVMEMLKNMPDQDKDPK